MSIISPSVYSRKGQMDYLKSLHIWMLDYKGYHVLFLVSFALCAYSHFK